MKKREEEKLRYSVPDVRKYPTHTCSISHLFKSGIFKYGAKINKHHQEFTTVLGVIYL